MYSPNLLKILGTDMAAEVLNPKNSSEQRLFQAIVLQAFEDALTTQGSKQESYLKKDAHHISWAFFYSFSIHFFIRRGPICFCI